MPQRTIKCDRCVGRGYSPNGMCNVCGGSGFLPIPSDYEPCGECGYDHEYEPVEAEQSHRENAIDKAEYLYGENKMNEDIDVSDSDVIIEGEEETEFDKFMTSTLKKESKKLIKEDKEVSPQRRLARSYQENPLGRIKFRSTK